MITILQKPMSDNHKNPMFFMGTIASGIKDGKKFKLSTYQLGEISLDGKNYCGSEILALGASINLNDDDLDEDNDNNISILVDSFFAIYDGEKVLEEYIYDEYDEALLVFNQFINNTF